MKENRKRFYLQYTFLAALIFGGISLIFLAYGKSMIWNSDGLKQHYISLAYYGRYLRTILRNIFVTHTFEIPMWDLHIGFGADIVTTLNYYVLGDPLNLLSVFVPERYTEYLYGFLIFLRMYLAGIAFSRFCFFHKNCQLPVLLGSLVYMTSQWILTTGFDHPFFAGPCIYLPLIFLGVDKILAGKKPLVYILSLGLAGMANFYFFYMLGISTMIYGIFRYFMLYKRVDGKILGRLLWRFFLYSVTGLMISAVILLPVVMAVLGTERMAVTDYVPVLYKKSFYQMLPVSLIGSRLPRYTIIGVAGVGALSLGVLFLKRKKYTGMKAGAIFLAVMYAVPMVGHVMNGFSYVSNRWSWVTVWFLSYLFVKMYPEFFSLKKKERILLLLFGLLLGGYAAWMPQMRSLGNGMAAMELILTAIGIFILFGQKNRNACLKLLLIGSVGIGVVVNICNGFWLTAEGFTRLERYKDVGEAYETVHGGSYETLRSMPDAGSYRYGQNTPHTLYNAAMVNGLKGGQYYFSVAPPGVNSFFQEHGILSPAEQIFDGIDNRSWLMKLFSMKYFMGRDGQVPYGFAPIDGNEKAPGEIRIYADSNPLPFAYAYQEALDPNAFGKMSLYEKQEALLQGVLFDHSSLSECTPEFTSQEIPFQVKEADGVVFSENGFRVKKKEGSCVLEFPGMKDSETYLEAKGFQYHGRIKHPSRWFEESVVAQGEVRAEVPQDGSVNTETLILRSERSRFQSERDDFLFHMGYHGEPVTRIRLTFSQKGRYTFDSFKVVCQKMDTLNQWTDQRRETAKIDDLQTEGNQLSLSVSMDKPGALVLSVPYHPGWKLMVDGAAAEVKKANGLFLGTELSEGTHSVEFRYTTPYIHLGAVLTLVGILLLFFFQRQSSETTEVSGRK